MLRAMPSDLEREFELEFEDDTRGNGEVADSDEELDDSDGEVGEDEEIARVSVADDYDEPGWDPERFAQRFYELSTQSFESETELDARVNEIINDMEREYLFGGLLKKLKSAGSSLLKKGAALAKNLPIGQAIKGVTQLARGNLKGMLGSLAKAALSSGVIPGGAAVLPALQALGFPGGGGDDQGGGGGGAPSMGMPQLPDMSSWMNLMQMMRDSYGQLAQELTENPEDPIAASRSATRAFQSGLRRAQMRGGSGNGRVRRIKLRPGETLIIEG
jgi:hypothetical protein